jgi:hypothetical protein
MRETIFDVIFNLQFFAVICKFCCIANRLQKSAGGGSPGTEVCPKGQTLDSAPLDVHLARMLPFQAQQRKANVPGSRMATERLPELFGAYCSFHVQLPASPSGPVSIAPSWRNVSHPGQQQQRLSGRTRDPLAQESISQEITRETIASAPH